MSETCEAWVPAAAGLDPAAILMRCGMPAVAVHDYGCVHEHVRRGATCAEHAPEPGAVGCARCLMAGHFCDESWAEVARDSREALALLGRATGPRCLPGEPDHGRCGGTFAQHACAHLAALKAIADHELSHLGPAWAPEIFAIYNRERGKLEAGCGSHA